MEKGLQASADQLRKIREKAAASLTEKTTELLLALGLKNARLAVEFVAEPELKEFGDSHCVMQFSPNAGQTPLPLSKIASSGEIARVMLALKAVLAEGKRQVWRILHTLCFTKCVEARPGLMEKKL